jgi:hypothetical protein
MITTLYTFFDMMRSKHTEKSMIVSACLVLAELDRNQKIRLRDAALEFVKFVESQIQQKDN